MRPGAELCDADVLFPLTCESKRHLKVISGLTDTHYDMHAGCPCNELRSLRTRVLMDTPEPDKWLLDEVRRDAVVLGAKLQTSPVDYEQLISMFPSHKRKAYTRAYEDLKHRPLDIRRDGFVTGFIKAERVVCGPQDHMPEMLDPLEVGKDPRMIQFRSMRFNLAFGRYTRPLERKLYQIRCPVAGTRIIAKGLNPHRRGALLKRVWEFYKVPLALSMDLHRFDAHVHLRFLELLHDLYLAAIGSDEFERLLKAQLMNRGRTMGGFKYKTMGGVMSGDMTTALGNCAIVVLIYETLRRLLPAKLQRWTLVDDGDDHVIIGEQDVIKFLANILPSFWACLGHQLKVVGLVDRLPDVVFCQHRPMQVGGYTIMVPDIKKTLSTTLSIPGRVTDPYLWLQQVAYCRAIVHAGVPVLGPLFARLTILLGKPDTIDVGIRYWLNAYTKQLDVGLIKDTCSHDDRVEMAINTDYSITDQYRLEALAPSIVKALLGSQFVGTLPRVYASAVNTRLPNHGQSRSCVG